MLSAADVSQGTNLDALTERALDDISDYIDLPDRVDLQIEDDVNPEEAAIAILGRDWCRENAVLPVALKNNKLIVEHTHNDRAAWRRIAQRADLRDIEIIPSENAGNLIARIQAKFPDDTKSLTSETKNERFLHEHLLRAAQQHASDLFFEPTHNSVLIRQKRDGITRLVDRIPLERYRDLLGMMGARCMQQYQPDRPQKGRYNFERDGRQVYVRAQTLPRKLLQGSLPQFIFRILRPYYLMYRFKDLGMTELQQSILLSGMAMGKSATIICGPPGSGKTTTIYAALQELAPRDKKIYAIEDPVETYMPWIWQTEVSEVCTHAMATEAILRAAPDFLFVGETMNEADAGLALRMMLTAVACATTLHADTAAHGIRRLMELNISPRRIAENVGIIAAQRLINPICKECCDYEAPSMQTRLVFDRLKLHQFLPKTVAKRNHERAKDCDNCFGAGVIRPRRAVYEVCEINEHAQAAMENDATLREISLKLYDRDHPPMIVQAVHMLMNHEIDETTFDEIPRPYLDASSWIGVAA